MKILCNILFACILCCNISYALEEIPIDAQSDMLVNTDNQTKDVSKKVIESNAPESKSRLGKNTILNLSGSGTDIQNVVLVDKSIKKMYVAVLNNNDMEVIKEFPVLTGRVEGNKSKRGDEKTPEGVYYVLSYSTGEELVKRYGNYALIYGAGSFPLNYPNIIDKIEKKTGGGIWLHGVKPDLDKTYTQGCVAMNNTNFTSMSDNVSISTPVIIAEKLVYSDDKNYNNNREKYLNILSTFINSWKNNDKDSFKSMVHSKFKTLKGGSYKKYVNNKTHLMKVYPDKVIRNDNIKIFMKDDNYTLFDTNQYYCAANMSTYTNKKYYFISENNNMKLISEETYLLPIKKEPQLDNDITAFINNWLAAWRSQNIEKYIDNYDISFKSGKDNYSKWKEKKATLFALGNDISINISNIKWSYSGGEYKVEFVQEYSSGNIKDKGIKTLILSGCPSFFKIKSETWREI